MLPKWHILIGFVVSYLLVYFFNFSLLAGTIIFLSSFLIDVDHYLFYIVRRRERNLSKAYIWFINRTKKWDALTQEQRKKYKRTIIIFHGIEFWIILTVLSFYNSLFIFILIGIAIHMILDFIDIIQKREPFYSKLSQIYVWQTNKNKLLFR